MTPARAEEAKAATPDAGARAARLELAKLLSVPQDKLNALVEIAFAACDCVA